MKKYSSTIIIILLIVAIIGWTYIFGGSDGAEKISGLMTYSGLVFFIGYVKGHKDGE